MQWLTNYDVIHVATVLTVYGIETFHLPCFDIQQTLVATVLTVYGIETDLSKDCIMIFKLQQYLPFTVLKRSMPATTTVLFSFGCNSTYRLRY